MPARRDVRDSGDQAQRTAVALPILLELAPLGALLSAWGLAAWLAFPGSVTAGVAATILSLGFGVSGLGWLSVGERRLGWRILGGRLALVAIAFTMGFWLAVSTLSWIGCESSRCVDRRPGEAFMWATAIVWIFALFSPLASAVVLALRLRRDVAEA